MKFRLNSDGTVQVESGAGGALYRDARENFEADLNLRLQLPAGAVAMVYDDAARHVAFIDANGNAMPVEVAVSLLGPDAAILNLAYLIESQNLRQLQQRNGAALERRQVDAMPLAGQVKALLERVFKQ